MRPVKAVSGSPALIGDQVLPPSVVLNRPSSPPGRGSLQRRRMRFQVAAYRVSGDCGSMTRSFAPTWSLTNRTFCQVAPPSVVL